MLQPIPYNPGLRGRFTEQYGAPSYRPDSPGATFGPGILTWYKMVDGQKEAVAIMRTDH